MSDGIWEQYRRHDDPLPPRPTIPNPFWVRTAGHISTPLWELAGQLYVALRNYMSALDRRWEEITKKRNPLLADKLSELRPPFVEQQSVMGFNLGAEKFITQSFIPLARWAREFHAQMPAEIESTPSDEARFVALITAMRTDYRDLLNAKN